MFSFFWVNFKHRKHNKCLIKVVHTFYFKTCKVNTVALLIRGAVHICIKLINLTDLLKWYDSNEWFIHSHECSKESLVWCQDFWRWWPKCESVAHAVLQCDFRRLIWTTVIIPLWCICILFEASLFIVIGFGLYILQNSQWYRFGTTWG